MMKHIQTEPDLSPNSYRVPMTPAPKHRWFRWSLRAFFFAITAVCIWLGWNVNQVREPNAVIKLLESETGLDYSSIVALSPIEGMSTPIVWQLLGAKPVDVFARNRGDLPDEQLKLAAAFLPEVEVLEVDAETGGIRLWTKNGTSASAPKTVPPTAP
jgi:hypothetical protein